MFFFKILCAILNNVGGADITLASNALECSRASIAFSGLDPMMVAVGMARVPKTN